jgi:hypothetical protein
VADAHYLMAVLRQSRPIDTRLKSARVGHGPLARCRRPRRNLRQRIRVSTQELPLRAYPRGHFPTFGTAAGAGRDMGMQ